LLILGGFAFFAAVAWGRFTKRPIAIALAVAVVGFSPGTPSPNAVRYSLVKKGGGRCLIPRPWVESRLSVGGLGSGN
jgi:hypothetical protein